MTFYQIRTDPTPHRPFNIRWEEKHTCEKWLMKNWASSVKNEESIMRRKIFIDVGVVNFKGMKNVLFKHMLWQKRNEEGIVENFMKEK